MSTTAPIKDEAQLEKFKNYYLTEKPVYRNYALIILGLNTAFRIGDLLTLRWEDVFCEEKNSCRDHIISVSSNKKQGKREALPSMTAYGKYWIFYGRSAGKPGNRGSRPVPIFFRTAVRI